MKDYIELNPFRILGLHVEATQRDISKRITDIDIKNAMGMTPSFVYDEFFSAKLLRDTVNISTAVSKIEKSDDKLLYSLFWFGESEYDDSNSTALKHLFGGDVKAARTVWDESISAPISYKNALSYKNYSVHLFHSSFSESKFDFGTFIEGLGFACEFLNSNFFEDYSWTVNGDGFFLNRDKSYRAYCDIILESMVKDERTSAEISQVIHYLKRLGSDTVQYAIDVLTREEVQSVEAQVSETQSERDKMPQKANLYGINLAQSSQSTVRILKTLFPRQDLRYQIIADKYSEEILQCSIDYFNSIYDDPNSKADDVLTLLSLSRKYAVSGRVLDRIEETKIVVDEWVSSAPLRKKLNSIKGEMEHIQNRIDEINLDVQLIKLPLVAIKLINSCNPGLAKIKTTLGHRDSTFQQISDVVADNALNICVIYINAVMENINNNNQYSDYERQGIMHEVMDALIPALDKVGRMNLSSDLRTHYQDLCQQLNVSPV